ncbi:sulfotransferase [Pseudoalteromonas sp. SR44-5]|uniref:tetratricopeptide repeat-containing sulfotransferase family protein n=1 Tax=unclassified Pseudoalteromonas TaxID=194690 RepID=UPI0016040845|nr:MULTISPECIES: sulfotransferase [unclassified Pseudoalteromonas]MBB1333439.1 sulfotransferase [Pseudoalteromonas sp. SR41-6]MBB1366086.1 sulfotransferase [Pseudoalteromonas sp. SR44-5]MBB1436201.1 sulfotransferase [Pseudoalteromonas sp. SG43-6]MBB1458843.1 sulfotransferase [Pseudoalteromonas sp. SG41-8]MBB1479271.1 sulfotransferase [Pseudoalteromonas sp. SG41-2]
MLLKKANQLLAENKLQEAEFHYKTLLESDPQNGEALFGLGRIALRLERFDAAVYLLQRSCERLPNMLEPLHALADAFNGVNSPNDALTVLEYAKSIASHNPEPHYYLAQHYLTHGELDKAHTTFAQALSIGLYPVTAYILFELVQLGRFDQQHNYISNLHHLLTQTNNLRLKMVCYYALAKSYDQLNDIEQAVNYYKLANKLQLQLSSFNTEQLTPFYQSIMRYNPKSLFATIKPGFTGTVTPVFIIGMPRSGSTLLEQMLASHSEFASLGEDRCISSQIVAFIEQQTKLPYPECISALTPQLIEQARALYTARLKQAKPIRAFMINKLPANYQSLGLIYLLFPNAKFINLQRDFNATAWSVYSNYFAENEPYFCSLPEFKRYYDLYQGLMTHWQQAIPSAILDVHYEQLISEPRDTLKSVFTFLGTAFEAQCLDFYKSKKPVTTLSKAAVRKPLHNRAIEHWKRFETPLRALLNDAQTTSLDP